MPKNRIDIKFDSTNRGIWLSLITLYYSKLSNINKDHQVVIHFSKDIVVSNLEPIHLVTLACLIQSIYDKGISVALSSDNKEVSYYIYNELGFKYYWSAAYNHVDALHSDNIFNLWRIVDSEKDLYAKNVESYLKKEFFQGKDLSSINVCLIEAFYNIFDHADAKGNAFSLIKYDQNKQKLHVAISDFGIGIVNSIRNNISDGIKLSDTDAIALSLKDSVTVKSTKHNKGLGLGNIMSSVEAARIFSSYGLYVKINSEEKLLSTTFSFPGTLIYFDLDLSDLDNEEILETFNW